MWPISPEQFKKLFPNSKIKATIEGISTDSRKVLPHEMFIALKGEKFDGHDFVVEILSKGATCALVTESWASQAPQEIREKLIEAKDTLSSFRDFAKKFRQTFDFPVFAIGGSNGKTTTKEMLHAILSGRNAAVTKTDKSENGFIGIAKTLTMKEHNQSQKIAALVLEIGIDEKDAMAQHVELSTPDCALLTALGPEHLEGLGSHEKAIAEELLLFKKCSGKPRIWQLSEPELARHFDLLEPQDCLVIDSDEFPREIENLGKSKISYLNRLYWRMEAQSPEKSKVYAQWVEGARDPISLRFDVPLPGKHNAQNFALALASALRMGWSVPEIESGWRKFKQPPMRSRIVELAKGITLYDDCYNASPLSVNAALNTLEKGSWKQRQKLVILGDMLDLGQESEKLHLSLVPQILGISNAKIILYGDRMEIIYKALGPKLKNKVFHLPEKRNPTDIFQEIDFPLENTIILVKGSRGMALERIVKHLETNFSPS